MGENTWCQSQWTVLLLPSGRSFSKATARCGNRKYFVEHRPGQSGRGKLCRLKSWHDGLTRHLAVELSPNVRVNSIQPRTVNSDGFRSYTEQTYADPAPALEQLVGMIPLRRHGEPEDIADLTALLASYWASFITGQIILVDGVTPHGLRATFVTLCLEGEQNFNRFKMRLVMLTRVLPNPTSVVNLILTTVLRIMCEFELLMRPIVNSIFPSRVFSRSDPLPFVPEPVFVFSITFPYSTSS